MMVWYKTECILKVKTRWKIETHPIILLAYAYNYIVGLRKVRMFEPLFICCAFEAKLLPSKLCYHTHFNVCPVMHTCAI